MDNDWLLRRTQTSGLGLGAAEDEARVLLEQGEQRAVRIFTGFVDFAFSGNILEIAFGLIIASAFTSLTESLVNDVLLPPLSVLLPLNRNLDEKFAVLKPGPHYGQLDGYTTLDQAQADGAVVLAYGVFVSRSLSFLALGIALYGLANLYEWMAHDPILNHYVSCRYCTRRVSENAIRCVNCTSWLDGREERMR
ncbi:gated mechanosensitive channel [Xylariomycetidae sp. FL2044]|nr:gated mechanosensitive channel [Xylariomycetidae sp. FL2044]KAH9897203.1 gated mechanosensitive channel [Xylariomycetidae sp. FL2044]